MGILGADDVTFYVPPSAPPPRAPATDDVVDVAKVWALAGDRHTAADIAAAFSGERFAVYDKLAEMVHGRAARDRSPPARAHELRGRARGRRARPAAPAAIAPARSRWRSQALHQDPSDPEVRKTFAQIERARVAEVAKQLLVASSRAQAREGGRRPRSGFADAEIELAARVDGRWDLLSLIRSANIREAEALLAFAHLAEVGVVELG